MKFSKRLFLIAGLYGLVGLVPLYFLEDFLGRHDPPPIAHPEFYFGFLGVAVAWQVLFLILARDPARFRPMIIPAILEKAGYGVAALVLVALGRATAGTALTGTIDLVFGALFVYSYVLLGQDTAQERRRL